MTVLIVGGDRLGNIPANLYEEGFKEIIHWSGRTKSFQNKVIPKKISKIVLFYNFLNHNLMQNIKRQAKENNIPIVYSKRALLVEAS